jgi:hypothetical protein
VRRLAFSSVLVFVAVLALACGPRVAHAQLLSLSYAKGDHYQYKLHLTSNNKVDSGLTPTTVKFDLSATESVSVLSVDSAGVADARLSLSKVTMKVGFTAAGNTTETTTTTTLPDIDAKIGPDGRVSVGTPNGFMSGMNGGPSFSSAVLPDTAVKPGDTWSKDYDVPLRVGSGSVHITTKSTYLRDETVKGVSSAVVETKSTASLTLTIDPSAFIPTATGGQGSASGGAQPTGAGASGSFTIKETIASDTTSWIDPAAHRILKTRDTSKYNGTVTVNMAADPTAHAFVTSFPINGSQTLTLDPA